MDGSLVSKDVAQYMLRWMNMTTKKSLVQTCKFWHRMIKHIDWSCPVHVFHCRLCVSRINNSGQCSNRRVVHTCHRCHRTFCKHLRVKFKTVTDNGRPPRQVVVDRSPNRCGLCWSFWKT